MFWSFSALCLRSWIDNSIPCLYLFGGLYELSLYPYDQLVACLVRPPTGLYLLRHNIYRAIHLVTTYVVASSIIYSINLHWLSSARGRLVKPYHYIEPAEVDRSLCIIGLLL